MSDYRLTQQDVQHERLMAYSNGNMLANCEDCGCAIPVELSRCADCSERNSNA